MLLASRSCRRFLLRNHIRRLRAVRHTMRCSLGAGRRDGSGVHRVVGCWGMVAMPARPEFFHHLRPQPDLYDSAKSTDVHYHDSCFPGFISLHVRQPR